MQPLPLKWKIFRIANYLHLSGLIGILILTVYAFFSSGANSTEDWLILFAFIAGVSILIANCIINWYLLDRCYPDKRPAKRLLIAAIIILILSLTGIAFFVFMFAFGVLTQQSRGVVRPEGIFLLAILGILVITGFYICWQQVVLKKTIRRNYQQTMDNFLNTDTQV